MNNIAIPKLEDMSSENRKQHPDCDQDEWIGPRPMQELINQPKRKKKKVLEHEDVYLSNIPSSDYYEKSYMHRDIVTHAVSTKTDFIITASIDGFIKFWKKKAEGIEFVKTFRAHLEAIQHICVNATGRQLATISLDKYAKIFDVENFDMINMIKLNFVPLTCEWIHQASDLQPLLAISESETQNIQIFSALEASNEPFQILDSIHTKPVHLIKYNIAYDVAVSTDEIGMIEYWSGRRDDFKTPSCVQFKSKLDTDLFEFVKKKTVPKAISISPDGQLIAMMGTDKMIRIFKFLSGKLTRVFDETTQEIATLQQEKQLIGNMEFSKRLAVEKEVDKGGQLTTTSLVFDESNNFLMYPTLLGVKVVNLCTNRLARLIGRPENMRILFLALFQGKLNNEKQAITVEMQAADNPILNCTKTDPTLVVTSFKRNRFYLFSKRDHSDPRNADTDRDVFNEKPSKEDIFSATDMGEVQRLYETAILHTSHGDIHLKLFDKECPKTVENFCLHAKNGYFNGHVFHRVIKQFMIQTGDPLGNGIGGESIWGGEFEDEFHPNLKHDRPYTLSMANAGPNSNGSQFFITVVPAPWLDNKHTVFGRVIRGLEVAQTISNVKTNPKTDKPYDDVILISISMK